MVKRSLFASAARQAPKDPRDFTPPADIPRAAWNRFVDYREQLATQYTNAPAFTFNELRQAADATLKAMSDRQLSAELVLDEAIRLRLRKPTYFTPGQTGAPAFPPIDPPKLPAAPADDGLAPRRASRRTPAMHRPGDVGVKVWEQWTEFRRKKKAPVTDLVLEESRKEAAIAGVSLEDYLTKWLASGTTSFQASYIKSADAVTQIGAPRRMTQHEINSQRGAALREPLAPKLFGENREAHSGHVEDVEFRESTPPADDPYKGF